jgi:hypothetical protein
MPWLVLVIVLAAGCAGRLENEERFDNYECTTEYVEQLFVAKCGDCHGATESQAGLDLVSPPMAQRLVGMPSFVEGECTERTLIAVDGNHLLVDKLGASPSCGSPMPLDGTLAKSDRDCIARWSDDLAAEAP